MANILEPIKNTKNLKSLLTNLLHRGPLKTTSRAACSQRAAGWAALAKTNNAQLSRKLSSYTISQAQISYSAALPCFRTFYMRQF